MLNAVMSTSNEVYCTPPPNRRSHQDLTTSSVQKSRPRRSGVNVARNNIKCGSTTKSGTLREMIIFLLTISGFCLQSFRRGAPENYTIF